MSGDSSVDRDMARTDAWRPRPSRTSTTRQRVLQERPAGVLGASRADLLVIVGYDHLRGVARLGGCRARSRPHGTTPGCPGAASDAHAVGATERRWLGVGGHQVEADDRVSLEPSMLGHQACSVGASSAPSTGTTCRCGSSLSPARGSRGTGGWRVTVPAAAAAPGAQGPWRRYLRVRDRHKHAKMAEVWLGDRGRCRRRGSVRCSPAAAATLG